MLPTHVLELRTYIAPDGRSPFEDWFADIDSNARAKVTVALARMAQGNLSNAKSVGEGVQEHRIDFGPGYRVYFGRDGQKLVILLAGGTNRRDKEAAATRYRRRAGPLARLQAREMNERNRRWRRQGVSKHWCNGM